MKFVTYSRKGSTSIGAIVNDSVLDLPTIAGKGFPTSMLDLIEAGSAALSKAKTAVQTATDGQKEGKLNARTRSAMIPLKSAKLLAPLPNPRKIFCLAGNYAEHIREGSGSVQEKDMITPRVFAKPVSNTIAGPYDSIRAARTAQFVDWEGELAVIIGRKCKYVTQDRAMSVVYGYTVFNDVSERKLKIRERPESAEWDKFFDWLNGKWCDSFAPTGPSIVTKDEIKDPQNLNVETRVNRVTKQIGNTGQMIFNIANIIEYISHFLTLEPGDMIATGTPSGVGSARGECLQPGDVVEVEIEKIGVIRNKVIGER